MTDRLKARGKQVRREVEKEARRHVHKLEEQLTTLQQEYDIADRDREQLRRQVEDVTMTKEDADRQLREQRDYQDKARQKETARLRDKCAELVGEIEDKDKQIASLSATIVDKESQFTSRMSQIENRHADEIMERDDLLAQEKKDWRTTELRLRNDVARKETELEQVTAMMESRVVELRQELEEQARSTLARGTKRTRNRNTRLVSVVWNHNMPKNSCNVRRSLLLRRRRSRLQNYGCGMSWLIRSRKWRKPPRCWNYGQRNCDKN